MQAIQDLKYSLRLLYKTPAFTAITFLIIAVGLSLYMAANTLATSMTDKPLPFPNGDRYVVAKTTIGNNENGFANHDQYTFNQLKASNESYSLLGAFNVFSSVFTDGDYARTYQGAAISGELIKATNLTPVLGRTFELADASPAAENTVIIGYSLWQDYYSGASDIVGKSSLLNGEAYTIVGVMPEGFKFPMIESFWLPLKSSEAILPGEGTPISIVGILNDDSDLASASVEIGALIARMSEDYPEYYSNRTELVTPYATILSPSNINIGGMLNFITLIILALMTINLSSLLFIRSTARQHELAVRSSVGAVGWQLARQVLAESFVICSGGLVLAILLTLFLLNFIETRLLSSLVFQPFWITMELNLSTLMSGILATIITWLASGTFAAFKAYRTHSSSLLTTGDKASASKSKGKLTQLIVGTEVILSCFLLICCGATLYLVNQLMDADSGVVTEGTVIANFSLATPNYVQDQDRQRYLSELKDGVLKMPNVSAVSFSTTPPGLFGGGGGRYEIEDRDLSNNDQFPEQNSIWVSEGYFADLSIRPTSGREFDGSDSSTTEAVVVISEILAEQLWQDESAIGRRIRVSSSNQSEWLTIVGVIPPILQAPFRRGRPSFYRPLTQSSPGDYFLLMKIRGQVDLSNLEGSINLIAASVDRGIPVENIRTLDRAIYLGKGGMDIIVEIFSMFSFATLVLAGIGIYGVIARSVSQRTREIGIRRALGSTNKKITSRFFRQGFYFLAAGVLFGVIPACLVVVSLSSNFNLNTLVSLPTVVISVVFIMAFPVMLSCYVPVRRALVLEPGDALRYE